MTNDRNTGTDADESAQNNAEETSRQQNEDGETASGEDDYKRDESNRGERPDNLRRRSEWFQKRTGGK